MQDGGRILDFWVGSSEVRLQHKVDVNTVRPGELCEKFGMDVRITCTTSDLLGSFSIVDAGLIAEGGRNEQGRQSHRASSLQWTHLCVSGVNL